MELHLSQTFESLNNSILSTIGQNGCRIDAINTSSTVTNEQKVVVKQRGLKQPRPRDGHSCEVYGKQMIIFGGDRHHMSFNDVILIDLERVVTKEGKCINR